MITVYLNVTDGQTDGQFILWHHRWVKIGKHNIAEYYRYGRYFNLKLPVYCRFKQVNGITTAKEITEDLMQITESTIITKNVHSC